MNYSSASNTVSVIEYELMQEATLKAYIQTLVQYLVEQQERWR